MIAVISLFMSIVIYRRYIRVMEQCYFGYNPVVILPTAVEKKFVEPPVPSVTFGNLLLISSVILVLLEDFGGIGIL